MQSKKKNLPAMPFYIGDWKKDPGIQVLTREQKMIWFEILMLMWESSERGYLTINNKPITNEMLAVALNLDNQNLSKTLTSFKELGLYSCRESDGAIYSRKQVEIIELSEKRKNAGIQGGSPILVKHRLSKKKAKGLANTENESVSVNENEIDIKLVMDHWNSIAKEMNLSQIISITKKRLNNVRVRIKEPEFNLNEIVSQIKKSDFLKGINKTGWKVDFDFITSSKDNYLKILEGKYNGTNHEHSNNRFTEDEYKTGYKKLFEG